MHDMEREAYGLDKIWSKFKYVYHWNFDTPHTSVVSNLSNMDIFI